MEEAMSRSIVFTLAELARMAGLSKRRTETLLRTNGVPMHRSGNRRVILVSSIERAWPELTDAIRFRRGDDE
jgi:hypothetical protein